MSANNVERDSPHNSHVHAICSVCIRTYLEGGLERRGQVGVLLLLHLVGKRKGVAVGGARGHRVGPPDGRDVLSSSSWIRGIRWMMSVGWSVSGLVDPPKTCVRCNTCLRGEGHADGDEGRDEEGDVQGLLLHLARLARAEGGDGEHPPAPAERGGRVVGGV